MIVNKALFWVCLLVCLFVCLFVFRSFVCLFVCLFVCFFFCFLLFFFGGGGLVSLFVLVLFWFGVFFNTRMLCRIFF